MLEIVVSPRYAGVVRAVMRCSVFVAFASSRRIESAVVGLGGLGFGARVVLVSGVRPGVVVSAGTAGVFLMCAVVSVWSRKFCGSGWVV